MLITEQYLPPTGNVAILKKHQGKFISNHNNVVRAYLPILCRMVRLLRGKVMACNWFGSRSTLMAVAVMAAAGVLSSTSAFAQGPDPSSQGQNPSVQLQPVIVTAEHRSQFLQNVPISINVVSAHAAAAMGVTNMSDLSVLVPGLLIGAANGGSTLTIRGIAGTSTSGDENATAIYVDGVYVANEPSTIFALSNIQSVQVLKGPQGTLFGRNSIGGAILVTTKAPSQVSDAEVELGYGNYATTTAQFYGTTGITKTIAANFSIYTQNMGEGWGDNTYLNQQAHQGHETDIRSMISWDPSGDTNATLILSANDVYDPSVQSYQVYPGYYTAAHVLSNGFWNASSDMNQFAAEITRDVALKVRHDFGWATLDSVTDYDYSLFPMGFDQDATSLPLSDIYLNRMATTETQELRLLSPSHRRFTWQVGTFYLHNVYSYAPIDFVDAHFKLNSTMMKQSYAVYGQGTLDLGLHTYLTLGTRYTSDHVGMDGTRSPTVAGYPVMQSTVSSRETYRASLSHRFSQNYMTYVSYNTGYKSGLYNMSNPLNPYAKPEYVTEYEWGFKSQMFHQRLNWDADVWYNSFTNMQVKAALNGAVILQNAARATIKGADFDFHVLLTRRLELLGGATYENGFYNSFPASQLYFFLPLGGETTGIGSVTGARTVQTPPWVYNIGAMYIVPTSRGNLNFNVNFSHTDKFYWDPQNVVPQSSYNVLNGQVKWSPSTHFDFTLWIKNALNAQYYAEGNPTGFGPTGYPAAPRTFGISGEWHLR